MSPKIHAEFGAHLEQLTRLVAEIGSTAIRVDAATPSMIEIAAIAAMLHAFYNGIENTLKGLTLASARGLPTGND